MTAPTTYVVLPVRDQGELAVRVLDRLRSEAHSIVLWVMDNGSQSPTKALLAAALEDWPGYVRLRNVPELSLHAIWHAAWTSAAMHAREFEQDRWEVAFLNSDIDFIPGAVGVMRYALRADERLGAVCPDYNRRVHNACEITGAVRYVSGSYREGGMCGWCFMVKGELGLCGVDVDEQFEIWYGDDDLFRQVETTGYRLGIVTDLALDHVGEATVRNFPELHEAKGRDAERFRQKWGAA